MSTSSLRLRRPSNRERANSVPLRKGYRSAVKWAGWSFILLSALPITLAGIFLTGPLFGLFIGLIFFPFLLLLVPLGFWRTILVIGADKVFRFVILPKHQDGFLKRFRVPVATGSKYFLGPPGLPNSLTWRMLQTVSVVFLFASKATTQLAIVRTAAVEEGWFFGLALAALCLAMPFVALLWLYEDSGVRVYNQEARTLSRVGAWAQQFLFGTGVAISVWNFALSVQGGTAQQIGLLSVLAFILVPPCLVVTVVFHRNFQPMFVERFRRSRSASFLAQREVELIPIPQHP